MQADGGIVRCSREENAELFSLALGGYGLFGIILDANLRVVPNARYRLEQFVVPVERALEAFRRKVEEQPDVAMVYARMNIVPADFLEDVIISVFYRDPAPDGSVPELSEPGLDQLRRSLFRGQVGSDYGKELRWEAETKLQPNLIGHHFSRNQLLNEGVEVFLNRSTESTDILHEYFVPPNGVVGFVQNLRRIISPARWRSAQCHGPLDRHGPGHLPALCRSANVLLRHAVQPETDGQGRGPDASDDSGPDRRGPRSGRPALSPLPAACHGRTAPPRLSPGRALF